MPRNLLFGLALVLAGMGCQKKPKDKLPIDEARAILVENLNGAYGAGGVASMHGDVLVIESLQCLDPGQAKQIVQLARQAGKRAMLEDVVCKPPPPPTKTELVSRFNVEFKDIGARASVEDEGRALNIVARLCAEEKRANKLLADAALLSKQAGFSVVRCGAEGGLFFERSLDGTATKPPPKSADPAP